MEATLTQELAYDYKDDKGKNCTDRNDNSSAAPRVGPRLFKTGIQSIDFQILPDQFRRGLPTQAGVIAGLCLASDCSQVRPFQFSFTRNLSKLFSVLAAIIDGSHILVSRILWPQHVRFRLVFRRQA